MSASAHHSFTFNWRFLYELKHNVRLSKTVCGIFHFRFRFFFIQVNIFCSTKCMYSLTLKRHNSFQNCNNKKTVTVLLPDLWFVRYNKQFQNSMTSEWVGVLEKLTWWQIFYVSKIKVLKTSGFLFRNFKVNIWHPFT